MGKLEGMGVGLVSDSCLSRQCQIEEQSRIVASGRPRVKWMRPWMLPRVLWRACSKTPLYASTIDQPLPLL